VKLAIATPFYEVKAYSPYIVALINSLKVLDELGIAYDYYELSGDSYVDRAKNTLIDKFLKGDCTHILMIDSDLSWDVPGFARLIKDALAGAEVIGGGYPNKNNWTTFGVIPMAEDGVPIGIDNGIIRVLEVRGIPGGFIVYSRKAIERARPNLQSYVDLKTGEEFLECFKCNIEEHGGRIGEDIYFQERYREMGGKVWLEPNISFKHFGVKAWEGNYHEYLLGENLHE
jgi:hypothetical protein